MNTLTIELPKETAEKLDLLKQAYEKKTGASISESTLVQTLISKEFIQAITPFDLQQLSLKRTALIAVLFILYQELTGSLPPNNSLLQPNFF